MSTLAWTLLLTHARRHPPWLRAVPTGALVQLIATGAVLPAARWHASGLPAIEVLIAELRRREHSTVCHDAQE